MLEIILMFLVLVLVIMLRKPIGYFLNKTEKVADSLNSKVDVWCQEMDTNTLKELEKLKEKGKVDLEARKKLTQMLDEFN